MKLRVKLLLYIIISTAIVFIFSVGFVNYRYWQYTKKLAFNIADLYTKQNALNAQNILMTNISDELAIVHLAKDFQKKVSDSCNEMQNIKVFTNSIRPLIRLKESSIVNLDLNLDLPIKELELYIQTLKNEFYNKFLFKICAIILRI